MSPLVRLRATGLARRLAVFFGMLAIVVQLGVLVAHDPAGLGAAVPWLGVALCHAGGGDAPAVPADNKSAPCPICLGFLSGVAVLMPPHPAMIALAAMPASEPRPIDRHTICRGHDPGTPTQPRAPPVSV